VTPTGSKLEGSVTQGRSALRSAQPWAQNCAGPSGHDRIAFARAALRGHSGALTARRIGEKQSLRPKRDEKRVGCGNAALGYSLSEF
jgi:hypothetical protein